MKKPTYLLSSLLLLAACSSPKEKIPDTNLDSRPPGKIIIYQLMTRLFGNQKQVNHVYGTADENGVGKFNDINDRALDAVKELGVTHIWYTGVIEHASLTDYTRFAIPLDDADIVEGRAGSPYAIKDYYDVDPDLAVDVPNRMKEFEQLVQRSHAHGLKVVIDFVPNHVFRAYHSDKKPEGVRDFGVDDDKGKTFSPANNYYYLPGQSFQPPKDYNPLGPNTFPTKDGKFDENPAKVTGNDVFSPSPAVSDWFETVKLNYGVDIQQGGKTYFDPVPSTWEKVRDILVFWAKKGVDGFRCDMAEKVPVEFWHWAIPQVKAVRSDIIFIAEIYNPSRYTDYIEKGRFDFLYDKVQLYDTLRLLTNQMAHTSAIARIQDNLSTINQNMLHFLENHDEQRIASRFFAGDGWRAMPAMVISSTIDKGPVMIYFGQEVGEQGLGTEGFGGDDGRTTIYDYWGVPEFQKWTNGGKFDGAALSDDQKQLRQFYGDILSLAKSNPAISAGGYIDLTEPNVRTHSMSTLIHAFARYSGEERLLIVSNFSPKTEHVKIQVPPDAVSRMGLLSSQEYIGHDLLRSSADVGFDKTFTMETDIQAFSSFIFKIK